MPHRQWLGRHRGFGSDSRADNGNFADQNGDGFGCFNVNRGQSAKHGSESWTWKDNTNPLVED